MRAAGARKTTRAGAYADRKLPKVVRTSHCLACGKPRPELADRPFGWDVHFDADTNTWTVSCSPACRAQCALKERYA